MSIQGSVVTLGGIRIPTLLVGFAVSVSAHVGILATFTLVPANEGRPAAAAPVVEFSIGEPIRVRFVANRVEERLPSDNDSDTAVDGGEEAAVSLHSAAEAGSESSPVNGTEPQVEGITPGSLWLGWKKFIDSLQHVQWYSSVSAAPDTTQGSDRELAEEPEKMPTKRSDGSSKQIARAEHALASERPPEPIEHSSVVAQPKTPRGIDRGIAIVKLPQPVYPRRSVRLGQEGTASIEVSVRADGVVTGVRVRNSSGYRLLDKAAVEAAKNGQFRPAVRRGRSIDAIVIIPFEFTLRSNH